MAATRRGNTANLSGAGTSAVPNLALIAGLAAGDRKLACACVAGNKTATIAIADAGGAWTVLLTRYNATSDETMFLASKVHAGGDGNPTISWTGAAAWFAGVIAAYGSLGGSVTVTMSAANDDYAFGDSQLPFNAGVNTDVNDLIVAAAFAFNTATTATLAAFTLFLGNSSLGANIVPSFWWNNTPGVVPFTPANLVFASGVTCGSEYTLSFVEGAPPGGGDERRRRR